MDRWLVALPPPLQPTCLYVPNKIMYLFTVDNDTLRRFIGLPTAQARYQVLHSCLEELVRVGIILPPFMLPK